MRRIPLRARPRAAFTLVEVLITTAMLALLAAATIPAVQTRLVVAHGNALAAELSNLSQGIQAFRSDVGVYPRYLDHLVGVTAGISENSCSNILSQQLITSTQAAKWRGPYVSRPITGNYTTSENETVDDLLQRATSGNQNYLRIEVDNVDSTVAAVVESTVDGPLGGTSYASGTIRWSKVSGTIGFIQYQIAVPPSPNGC